MERKMQTLAAVGLAIALLAASGPAMAEYQSSSNDKTARGGKNGSYGGGGGCFCLLRGNGDNSVYPNSGVSRTNGHVASTTEGAAGPDTP